MLSRVVRVLRANSLGLVAIALVVGGGGGYALATAHTGTITACADKRTGVLHLDRRGRCSKRQTRVSWNQAGSPGPAGAPAVKAWAAVAQDGQAVGGRGLSVQHVSAGTYLVTVTVPGCGGGLNSAPVVSITNAYPLSGQSAGSYPVSWVGAGAGVEQFDVYTGLVVSGSFSLVDQSFEVQEACS